MRTTLQRRAMRLFAIGLGLTLVAAAGLASFHFATVAHAQSPGMTMSIGNGTLVNRVTVNVPVTITCTLPAGSTVQSNGDQVTVSQAAGNVITSASGGFSTPTGLICDSLPHIYQASLTPSAGSPPFHGGRAVASGNAFECYTDQFFNFNCVGASVNSAPIRIGV